tara:strand:- start:94 stop:1809 length:1716 start_codon:yes stop_codon:yes gene_type:complete
MADVERQKLLFMMKRAGEDQNVEAQRQIAGMLEKYDSENQTLMDIAPKPSGQMYDTQQRGMGAQSGAALAQIGEGLQDVFGEEGILTSEGIAKRISNAKVGFAKDPMASVPLAVSRMMTAAGDAVITGAKPFVMPVVNAVGDALQPHVERTLEPLVVLGNVMAENENIGPLLELAEESFSAFTEELKNYPEEAKVIQAYFDTAGLMSPATRLKNISAADVTTLEETGHNLVRGGRAQVKGERKALIQNMLDPISKHGRGRTTIEGVTRSKTYNPIEIEQEAINVLSSLPSIKPNAPYTTTFNTVSDEIGNTRNRLDARIAKAGNPEIPMEAVLDTLSTNATKALRSPAILGNTEEALKKILAETQRQLEASDGTALGLLNARRNVDKWILDSRGSAFDGDFENAITASRRVMADTLNTLVSEAVPNVNVDEMLRKQMLMYQARGVIEQKAIQEANTGIGRAMQRVELVTGAKLPVTPLAAAATGGAGVALAASGVMPYVGLGMAVAASGYGLTRLAMSPTTKKGLGQLLVGIGKAEKAAKGNAQVLADLKIDRALISSLLTDLRVEEEEQE